jgi:uncharacterized protein YydD (DUF2326 family)
MKPSLRSNESEDRPNVQVSTTQKHPVVSQDLKQRLTKLGINWRDLTNTILFKPEQFDTLYDEIVKVLANEYIRNHAQAVHERWSLVTNQLETTYDSETLDRLREDLKMIREWMTELSQR